MSFINLDWSLVDKKNLVHDLIKVFIFNFSAHLMSVIYFKEEFLNQKFILILFAIELGFTLFYVFFEPGVFHNIADRKVRADILAAANNIVSSITGTATKTS
jgi:hypothetical protein